VVFELEAPRTVGTGKPQIYTVAQPVKIYKRISGPCEMALQLLREKGT
jgi:hypothetical protein